MISRRRFMWVAGQAATALALPGCASSPPFKKEIFPDLGDAERPYLGLATSLRDEHDYEAQVVGVIPPQLRGTLYRNGPGLFDRGDLRKRALFDGDGMVQAFQFHDRGVRYRNRFVRTEKFVEEEKAGRFLFPSWSTQEPGGFLANFWGAGRVKYQAGVTVYLRNGRLYAFDDTGFPYELDPDTLETIGESKLGLPDELTVYAAHSKMDRRTGEWLHFGILYGPKPRLHLTVFDQSGGLKLHRSFPLPRYVYMHDWIVSDRHFIISLHPAEIHFWQFLLGCKSLSESLSWEPDKGNLIMVVEREGDAAPVFLNTPACYMWHSLNAFEKGGEIQADFVGYVNPDHFIGKDTVVSAIMTGGRGETAHNGELRRYIIDPAERTIRPELLDRGSYEWPRVNELHLTHGYRFGYLAKTRPREFFWSIITRVDMSGGATQEYHFGEGVYCTEAVFVPLPEFTYAPRGEEPGWLLTEAYDSHTKKSYLAVLRADRLEDGPVATINLRHHVPFSFHGWWSAAS